GKPEQGAGPAVAGKTKRPVGTSDISPRLSCAGGLGVREDADGERQQPRRDPEASQEMAEAPGFHGRASPEQGMAG
ncbi:hypothetical protein XENORESO_019419, partial [Xenotaenia resolanae]